MSKRTEQVAALLCTAINEIIIKDFEAPKGTLISVSMVTISADLKNATAYVSVIPQDKLGTGLEAIRKFSGHVQKGIGKYLTMHTTPKINWELDERDLKYSAIDEALRQ
ncbi:MAG: ribosome-binding factor A [bacterium]|nr:ribosome-binding factor A [bacterium]